MLRCSVIVDTFAQKMRESVHDHGGKRDQGESGAGGSPPPACFTKFAPESQSEIASPEYRPVWLMDRPWHGVRRIAARTRRTHVLIRVNSDTVLKKIPEILPGGSDRAEISGEGITITVRVIEYDADIEGQDVKEMFCLVTDLLDWQEHPALELSGLCKWRWDGPETGLREAKAPPHGAGPGTGAMLRSGSPALIAQEIAAWAASTEMTRGVSRAAALAAARAAALAKKGRRAGQPVRRRDLSLTRARGLILAAIGRERASHKALTRQITGYRTVTGRHRHRARKSKSPARSATPVRKTRPPAPPRPSSRSPTSPPGQPKLRRPPRNHSITPQTARPAPRKPVCRRPVTPAPAMPSKRRPRNVTKRKPPIKA
jgi:hypothetical protein